MPRPRSDIDQRIVRAALGRFLTDGVDGASVRAIARAAKTNLGMVTYYFPAKDDLFLAVVEEVYAGILRDIEDILKEDSTVDLLKRLSIRIGSMSKHELDVIRLVIREALVSPPRLHRVMERFKRGHIPLVVEMIGRGIARGELDATIPLPILIASIFGLVGAPQILRRAMEGEMPFPFPSVEETATQSAKLVRRALFVRKKKTAAAVAVVSSAKTRSRRRKNASS
jgi:AcrR family transcriptional regulator